MGQITKRGEYQWRAKVRRKGFPEQSRTFTYKEDAEKWVRMVESELETTGFIDRREAEKNSLAEVLKRYQREITPGKKSAVIESVKIDVLLRDAALVGLKMTAMTSVEVAKWRDRRLKEVTGGTVNREIDVLSAVFNHARREWGIHVENPIQSIKRPEKARSRERRLSPEEESYLLAALTCADDGSITPEQMEVIELGAVWATPAGEVIDTMQRFVRPTARPTLTPFCRSLTHIEQASIDAAPSWPAVAVDLAEFARLHAGQCWGSWGAYDRRQIERESARHGLADPLAGLPHQNLKAAFAKARKIKQVGMTTALQIVGLGLEGEHHRALSDARNIGRLLPWCLTQMPVDDWLHRQVGPAFDALKADPSSALTSEQIRRRLKRE